MSPKDWNRDKNCRIDLASSYKEVFDVIIVGAGPAGMTAAVYAARRKLTTLFLTGKVGGQMSWSSDLQNWTGITQTVGPILASQMINHVKAYQQGHSQFNLVLEEGVKATKIEQISSKDEKMLYAVEDEKGRVFKTRSIIMTVGKRPRLLGIPGEDTARKGKGLSFSATSDAPLYAGKKMVVIGGGNSAMDISLQLSKLTDDITIMTNLDDLRGETCMMHKIKHDPNIKVLTKTDSKEIIMNEANTWVKAVRFANSDGKEEVIACGGIFLSVGQVPSTAWLGDFVDQNERGNIKTNDLGHTSRVGVFAGGDCTTTKHRQVVVAAGQGAVAALECHEYLQKL